MGSEPVLSAGRLTFGGTFYYQSGKNAKKRDVSAFLWALNAAYKINSAMECCPRQRLPERCRQYGLPDAKYTAFDPLYGTHHKFYGAMDYYYATPVSAGFQSGTLGQSGEARLRRRKKSTCRSAYHYFSTTSDVTVKRQRPRPRTEFRTRLQVDWQIMKDVKALRRLLHDAPEHRRWKPSREAVKIVGKTWGWLSININPRMVFIAKWFVTAVSEMFFIFVRNISDTKSMLNEYNR